MSTSPFFAYTSGMANKATNTEIDERIHQVYDLLLRGYNKTQIVRHCADNFGIALRQSEEYLSRARTLQALDSEIERPQWLIGALTRLAEYERRASEKNQLSVAMRAVELQAKLLRFDMSV